MLKIKTNSKHQLYTVDLHRGGDIIVITVNDCVIGRIHEFNRTIELELVKNNYWGEAGILPKDRL